MAGRRVSETPSSAETAAYYQSFSLEAGAEHWLRDNGRHLRIRQELVRLLGAARGLQILDVGCGTGVLTSYLCRHGQVTGTDLSEPAIELARQLEPRARFVAGRFDQLDLGDNFDLITMFDVLEHVPTGERPALFTRLDALLGPRAWLVLTTPHPTYTRWLQKHRPDLLQIVDEPVPPEAVVELAGRHELDLVDYRAYDVDAPGARQYQLLAFARAHNALELPAGGFGRRMALQAAALPLGPLPTVHRFGHALRLARLNRRESARWLLGWQASPPVQRDR
jgi:SAM-dependent methyltransferase